MITENKPEQIELTEAQLKSRRHRNIAIALICGGLVVLFYVITIVKIGPSILSRPF